MMKQFSFKVYTYGEHAQKMLCGYDNHKEITIKADSAMDAYNEVVNMFPNTVITYDGDSFEYTGLPF